MIEKEQKQIQIQQPKWQYTTVKKGQNKRQLGQSTTPRRQPYRQPIRSRKDSGLSHRKWEIQQIYNNLMENSQYTEAERAAASIKYLTDQQKRRRTRILSQEHSIEKKIIQQAHKKEMRYFRQAWNEMFMRQEAEKINMLRKLSLFRAADEEECKQRIIKRCKSAKPVAKIAKLYQLQDCQKLLRKRGKTVELKKVRQQKKKIIKECKRQHQRSCAKIAEQQQKRMIQKETRRYNSFMHRIEQTKKDHERTYRREEHRLKQKYKNVLKNLEHEQKMSFMQI